MVVRCCKVARIYRTQKDHHRKRTRKRLENTRSHLLRSPTDKEWSSRFMLHPYHSELFMITLQNRKLISWCFFFSIENGAKRIVVFILFHKSIRFYESIFSDKVLLIRNQLLYVSIQRIKKIMFCPFSSMQIIFDWKWKIVKIIGW